MASWLMRSTEERTVWIRALAGDIVLYFSVNHSTLTVPLSTQVSEWVLVNLMLGDNPTMELHPIQGWGGGGGGVNTRFMLLNWDEL